MFASGATVLSFALEGATVKDARGALECNTQASALNIASSSSGAPTNALAAKISSNSPRLPDFNARALSTDEAQTLAMITVS